jgi:type II secretory pathway component GspD/PulD (secretin)
LQYAVAAEVANALSKLRPDVRVVADERTNSVIVACSTDVDMRQLRDCIAKLDIPVKDAK